MYQRLVIAGNLGHDPELRHTSDGTPVTTLSVATNRRWTNNDGSKGEETAWFRVTVWRRMAEVCAQYLSKGRAVLIEGRMRPDPETGGPKLWTDKDGNPRASFEVTADRVQFLGGGNGNGRPEPEEEEIPF